MAQNTYTFYFKINKLHNQSNVIRRDWAQAL